MIVTANSWFKTNFQDYKAKVLVPGMARQGVREGGGLLAGESLKAYVNQGRWIVSCECGGAEFAWEEGIFMCQSCWNSGHRHSYRPAEFPAERKQIEALLDERPLLNRNWYAAETTGQLQQENAEHKAELLEVN